MIDIKPNVFFLRKLYLLLHEDILYKRVILAIF